MTTWPLGDYTRNLGRCASHIYSVCEPGKVVEEWFFASSGAYLQYEPVTRQ